MDHLPDVQDFRCRDQPFDLVSRSSWPFLSGAVRYTYFVRRVSSGET